MTLSREAKRNIRTHAVVAEINEQFIDLRAKNKTAVETMNENYRAAHDFLTRIMTLLGDGWKYNVSPACVIQSVTLMLDVKDVSASQFRAACLHAERILGVTLYRVVDSTTFKDVALQAYRTCENFFLLIQQTAPSCKIKIEKRMVAKEEIVYENADICLGITKGESK